MSDAAALAAEASAPPDEEAEPQHVDRNQDLLGRRDSRTKIRQKLDDLFDTIARGFIDQAPRADEIEDYWDCYNCELNSNQVYSGNAQVYWPIIRDAVNARATRFSNQLFPPSGRYVEAVSTDGKTPWGILGLLDHYIRTRRLKTQVAKALCRNGDVEGQYNLYLDWAELDRQIVSRATHGPIIDVGMPMEVPGDLGGEEIDDIEEEDVIEGLPVFEVLHDSDVLVLPANADSVEEALACGGSVTIVRHWTKAKIEAMAESGAIREDEADDLIETMGKVSEGLLDIEKMLNEHVGIRMKGGHAVVWETWTMLKLGDKGKYSPDGKARLCRVFFGPSKAQLGAKRNPYWNDRCPLLSCPVEKISGAFKGGSLVAPVASIQYEANDAVNEGADAAHYSALPIVTVDPEKSDGPLILNLAAIWKVPPDSVRFMSFPDLTPRAVTRVQIAMSAIFQALGVNPAMLPQQTGRPGAKRNQAEIALELQVDLLTTAEAVSVLEEGIFTPAMGWCVDLDYQFRDRPVTVRAFGEMGLRAELEQVEPLRNRTGIEFRWWGVQQARNAAQAQQQIAWFATAMNPATIAALKEQGYAINPVPALELSAQSVFDSRTAALTIVDQRAQQTINAELENELMLAGHTMRVHPMDPDPEHLKTHQQAAQETGDPHGTIREHIAHHIQSMQMKLAQRAQQAGQQAMQGPGGPPGGRPSRSGAPARPGAQPAGPRLVRPPAGTIHRDQLARAGAPTMPRKM